MTVRPVPHPLEILHGDGVALACSPDGEVHAEELHGLFAGDTRVLSTYRFTIAGHAWRVLVRSRSGPAEAQWDLQNPAVRVPGAELAEGTVHLRLRRRIAGALHDDLEVCAYTNRVLPVRLALHVDADFSDIFQVKQRSIPPRLTIERVRTEHGISLCYQRRDFRRALHLTFTPSAGRIEFVGTQVVFDVPLAPGAPWTCCIDAEPELDGKRLGKRGDAHTRGEPPRPPGASVRAAPLLALPFERGLRDLDTLAMRANEGPPFPAAGVPWFMALFGRDTLVTALMSGLVGSWPIRGALTALARLQARERDDERDAEPGKLPHELRVGELAHFHAVPHTPYYGTHDAQALYVLALWHAWRWTGDRALVDAHLQAARAAMRWCETDGDPDGDGFLEYRTRSRRGYLNQGWKDASDAIPHEDGRHARPPIGTVELQGYLYAARLAMAELLTCVGIDATEQRAAAARLRDRIEGTFWMEDAGCYALALDGEKRLVRSISSNPGHLLWCGVPSAARAERVARRLLADDMYSGYGVRTLSAQHRSYNPLAYQLGSVWPHDNALLAAGLVRYRQFAAAERVLRGILDAAAAFEEQRLPELFCGMPRGDSPPVPYERANVPQAWAAAVPILAAQLFLGLCPDAPRGTIALAPWLPAWLPELVVSGVAVGDGELTVHLVRDGESARIVDAQHPTLKISVGAPEAALWGRPLA